MGKYILLTWTGCTKGGKHFTTPSTHSAPFRIILRLRRYVSNIKPFTMAWYSADFP